MSDGIPAKLRLGSSNRPDVVFLIGCWLGESKRYRVFNLCEGLSELGYSCLVHDFYALRDIIALDLRPRVLVLFRAPYELKTGVAELLDYCREQRIKTVFDVDDYVFNPAILPAIDAIRHFDADATSDYLWGIRAYRALLFACDMVTTSTPFLTEQAAADGREATTVNNSVNAAQLALAADLAGLPPRHDEIIRIGYYSGSATHNADFAVCAPALQAIMDRHPNVRFRLVGLLDLSEAWDRFADRIDRSGFLPPMDMLRDLHGCDICLAPLVENNPYCDGKSELKFFEAAIVDVPTVASRTRTYAAAISDGDTGLLASDDAEWEEKIGQLIGSAGLRRRLADRARAVVMQRYTTAYAARQALAAYGLEPMTDDGPRRITQRLSVGWILPGLIIGGGGHRNILRAAYHLEQFGYDVRLYVTDTAEDATTLHRQLRQHFYPFKGSIVPFNGTVDGEDVLFATHWSTVAPALSVRHEVGTIIYFVQDFEPAFYPMGSQYLAAENTYRAGLYAICSGPWCSALLASRYGMRADFFQFPVDTGTYKRGSHLRRRDQIVFFAKPDMPRRCFDLGVAALRLVKLRRPEIEIAFFGSRNQAATAVDFSVRQLGLLPTIGDLAELYQTSTIGIVFSTTNPSLVPYEMMACGLPVVDLDVDGAAINYGDSRDVALLGHTHPPVLADQILALLDDEDERQARSARGSDLVAGMPDEEAMARRIEQLMTAHCADLGRIDLDRLDQEHCDQAA